MREFAPPVTYRLPVAGNLTDDVVANALDYGADIGFSRLVGDAWLDVSWAEFRTDVLAAARGLIATGVQPGDRVALMSKTRYEWTVLDYAIWFAGGITVPVYETSSAEQIGWVLADSGAVLAIVETPTHATRVAPISSALPTLREIVCLEGGGLTELVAAGTSVQESEVEARREAVTPDDIATLIYTSGTTGRPKGCQLTHGNLMFEVGVATSLLQTVFATKDASTVLFLPLAHVFARVIAIGCVRARVRTGHTADIVDLVDNLRAFRPTFLLAVPRVFEKVFNTASTRFTSEGRGRLFASAVSTSISYSRALDRKGPGVLLRSRHAMLDRLVYARLRAALGGNLTFAISGGAPLGVRLAHFYRGAGVPVLEGYGLTESTAALTVNLPDAQRIGSVGRPLPGTTAHVADDGELLFRGGQVFTGYWGDRDATEQALVDGWLRTGDVGQIDEDGYVWVTGRKKEILVTAGGKNVAPAVLEDRLRAHPLVDNCIVVGDGRPYVAALVTLDPDATSAWRSQRIGRSASESAKDGPDPDDPDLLQEIQQAVDDANAAVSRAEAIRRFAIVDARWSETSGELTPTLKLRRDVVLRRYSHMVESLYA